MEFYSGQPENPAASVRDYCTGVLTIFVIIRSGKLRQRLMCEQSWQEVQTSWRMKGIAIHRFTLLLGTGPLQKSMPRWPLVQTQTYQPKMVKRRGT